MNMLDYLKRALCSVSNNFSRSMLTMLGIIISVASIICVLCVSAGGSARIKSEMELVGSERFFVYSEGDALSKEDALIPAAVTKKITAYSPMNTATLTASGPGTGSISCTVNGVGDQYASIEKIELALGRWPASEQAYEAVITNSMAEQLFNTGDALGRSFLLAGKSIYVCGIIDDGSLIMTGVTPYRCIIGIDAFNRILNISGVQELIFRTEGIALSDAEKIACEAIETATGKRGVKSYNMTAEINMVNQVLDILTGILISISAVCMLCGGIGVMNVMMVSVKERTREIGILKAIGAKSSQITGQFLTEAMLHSLLGGLMGVPLGALGAYFLCSFSGIEFILSASTVCTAVIITCAAGLFFGIYPALKAGRLKPIDALT